MTESTESSDVGEGSKYYESPEASVECEPAKLINRSVGKRRRIIVIVLYNNRV